jgi:DUF1680 family protein
MINGRTTKFARADGYVEIDRMWKRGDTVTFELPLRIQRVYASSKVSADSGRVALRYGPLVYNIEKVDQDIDNVLDPATPLTTEWRADLLSGVMTVRGQFKNGTTLLAVPNFARFNRQPPVIATSPPAPANAGPPPATSIVWIREV